MFSAAQERVSQAASPVGAPAHLVFLCAGLPLTLQPNAAADLSATLRATLFLVVSLRVPFFYRFHQSSAFAFS